MPSISTDDLFEQYGPAYRWLASITCMLGAMTMVLTQTTVNVAFPDIMGAFGIGRDQAQWLSSGFFAAMTAGMLISAWLISVFGERAVYVVSLILFLLGSAASGVAPNVDMLMSGRFLQGIAAGIIQPLAMSVMFRVFPPERRGAAMGLFSMGIVFAPAMGPTLGGVVIDFFNWRYIFFLTVPSIIMAIFMGLFFMPSRALPKKIPPFDLAGFLLICFSLFCLLFALGSGNRIGWASNQIVGTFTAAGIGFITFILWEISTEKPLMDLNLFRNPRFTSTAFLAFFVGGVFLSSTFLIPLFVQSIQGYTPLRAGLLLMPGGLLLLLLFPIAGRISDSLPAHVILISGLLAFIMAFVQLSTVDVNTPFWTFVYFTLFIRFGLAFTMPVINATALKALSSEQVNQGSGIISFVRMLGAAIWLNCVIAYLDFRVPSHSDALTATQTAANATTRQMLAAVEKLLAEAGAAENVQAPGALHFLSQVLYEQASTMGFQDAFLALSFLAAAGIAPAWYLSRAKAR
ncbi:MAG: DHA2 family efflux MFS transporter permease subunit [Alphaproteobacteria bacterium]|nr:DHA2 family efflux MFS transporter permease subunit [Alphaproteobacteria bacterium]